MQPVRYRLVSCPDGWRLFSDSERLGLFQDEASARRAAMAIARSSRLIGYDVEVLVETAQGDVRVLERDAP